MSQSKKESLKESEIQRSFPQYPLCDKMGAAFSRDKPLKEIVRENQRMIKKAIREMEREISNLKTQEKKLTADIKKSAKMDQMVIGKVHCLICCLKL